MRTVYYFLYKEFRQIFRNRAMLPIIFIMPIIQLVVLTLAANFEVKGLKLYWVDRDQSSISRQLQGKFQGSAYFELRGASFAPEAAEAALARDEADLVIEIPAGFERDLFRENEARIQLVVNAIDGVRGGLAGSYAQAMILDFNREIQHRYGFRVADPGSPPATPVRIRVIPANWFNPELDYKTFFVPGILGLLVTMIGAFLSSMNIAREKEIGTIEQLNVTPIKKAHFIIGKLLPFWILALFELSVGLVVAKLLYHTPFLGSFWVLYSFAALYLLVVLGLGLYISTVTETQQQAMFISWFILVIFILMSGLFTAIENMPPWAQALTWFNPIRYLMEVIRGVMLKGAGFADVGMQFLIVAGYALALNALAVWSYRKTA